MTLPALFFLLKFAFTQQEIFTWSKCYCPGPTADLLNPKLLEGVGRNRGMCLFCRLSRWLCCACDQGPMPWHTGERETACAMGGTWDVGAQPVPTSPLYNLLVLVVLLWLSFLTWKLKVMTLFASWVCCGCELISAKPPSTRRRRRYLNTCVVLRSLGGAWPLGGRV